MKKFCIIVMAIVALFILILAGIFGKSVPFESQWKLYETLRTTASIILAIMAAWIAIIYPDRLKIFKNAYKSTDTEYEKFEILLHPIINSLAILIIVLFIGILAPIANQIEFFLQYKSTLRCLSYVVLILLTFWQIYTIFTVFIPLDMTKRNNQIESDIQNEIDRINKRK